ncbi:MAG TPA: TIR domain-containing protein [Desulfobacteria bacterium]|nr:TIR domain-containing protein [Desulfobacteria bacterium]
MTKNRTNVKRFEHEVAISYAGEDREIAEQIAQSLRKKGVSVFYDKFYKVDLWGKSLSGWFRKKYGKSSRFVLVLISRHYPVKDWANFEFSIARAEEKKRKNDFILPVRLDNTKIPGLPSDKAYLDFKKEGLNGVIKSLIQKVKTAASEKDPEQIFREAYEEWKIHGFLPGETKVSYFLENINAIKLDVDTTEFLLRSLSGYFVSLKEKIKEVDKDIIFNAAIRLLGKEERYYDRLRALRYLVFANPKEAEPYLWGIYQNKEEETKLRIDAFERLWRCESERGLNESYAIALNEPEWGLRKAAMKNIGHGEVRKQTSEVLAKALKDKRWEVRAEAAYAIVRLNLDAIVPDMVNAIENERSRKGAYRILYCLSNFKEHPSVKYFMKKYEHDLPKWFEKTPDYHAVYEDIMDEML